jgi:hypothetical protein
MVRSPSHIFTRIIFLSFLLKYIIFYQLTEENEGLQETLKHSQENQKDLKVEVTTLHEKYQECYEMLMENQVSSLTSEFILEEALIYSTTISRCDVFVLHLFL